MLSDLFTGSDGHVYTDGCYHQSKYKGDHSECIKRLETFCLGCEKNIEEDQKVERSTIKSHFRQNDFFVSVAFHTECKSKVRKILIRTLIKKL